MAGGMKHAAVAVGHMGGNADELEAVHEADAEVAATLQSERHYATSAVGKILLLQGVLRVIFQVGIVDPCHSGIVMQVLCNAAGILAMTGHTQMERLQAKTQIECVLGRLDAAQVAHQLAGGLGNIGQFAESFRIDQSVVALIGGCQTGETLCMGRPVKIAAVHNHTAHTNAMAVHVLGGGMGYNVRTEFKGTAVDGGGKGVVDNQGHTVGMGNAGKLLNVEHLHAGVGKRLAKDQLGVGTESRIDFLLAGVLVNEGNLYAQLAQSGAEEVIRSAIDAVGGYHVVARLADVEAGIEVRRLSAGSEHGTHTALKSRNACRYMVVGGILQACIEIARILQVKQLAHLQTGFILEGGTLHNGHLARLALSGLVTRLNTQGSDILFHSFSSLILL